jgi:two-component system sensor histidine kinase UhpB
LIMLHRWWSSWAQRHFGQDEGLDAAAMPIEPFTQSARSAPSSRGRWMWLVTVGLVLALVVGYAIVRLNRETVRLSQPATIVAALATESVVRPLEQAWSVRSNAETFPASQVSQLVSLPDDWAKSNPGHQGAVWYRFSFDASPATSGQPIMAAYIERACSNVEVWLNGQLLYGGGRMADPYSRNCYRSHVVVLPAFLLHSSDNLLDLKVVGYPIDRVTARQRAGGLAAVRIGPLQQVHELYEAHEFWTTTVSQVLGGILVVLGMFALALAWVRRLNYLLHFGLLTMGWAVMTGRLWLGDTLIPNAGMEVLIAMMFAPMTAVAIKFLLGYAGQALRHVTQGKRKRQISAALWAQCLLLPLSLLLVGSDRLFLCARVWYVLFAVELFVTIGFFLWVAGRGRRPEFWLMSAALGAVTAVLGIELSFQNGLMRMWGVHITHFVMPLLYAAVAVRLIQVYGQALQSAEGARRQLEKRVHEISTEIERNFNQIAELRVEQIAEKERKRIAADLHDDLGAKLLTIVHTSDNDRISTLAREALEEMRLSVRGLTGKPMVLSDALADWRAEVVSRLGQAGIECEWRNPNDTIEEPLSSRTYVQTTRILREAVSNVIKHSGASHVVISVDVHLEHHDFVLVIQDNGKGIPLELDGRLDRGHGMTSMKHRAKQLSGQCLVESGPGFGTVIRLTLPLEMATMQQVLQHGLTMPAGAASMRNNVRGQ